MSSLFLLVVVIVTSFDGVRTTTQPQSVVMVWIHSRCMNIQHGSLPLAVIAYGWMGGCESNTAWEKKEWCHSHTIWTNHRNNTSTYKINVIYIYYYYFANESDKTNMEKSSRRHTTTRGKKALFPYSRKQEEERRRSGQRERGKNHEVKCHICRKDIWI